MVKLGSRLGSQDSGGGMGGPARLPTSPARENRSRAVEQLLFQA